MHPKIIKLDDKTNEKMIPLAEKMNELTKKTLNVLGLPNANFKWIFPTSVEFLPHLEIYNNKKQVIEQIELSHFNSLLYQTILEIQENLIKAKISP